VFGQTYEEQLLGAEAGETIEFDVTYDEDYDSERIAGKTIHYVVKINNVFELLDQELTDEYVEELTDSEYTTVEEFRQGCADMLMEDNKDRYVLTAGKQKLLEESEITGYPEEALEEDIEELREFYEGGASYVNMELADYLSTLTGRDKESSEEVLEQIAKDNLTEEMLIKAVAEKEEITLTDEEYETYLEEYLEELGDETTAEELEFAFGEENIKEAFTLKKTENYLLQLWEDQAE
jgi:trigger factor